MWLDMSTILKDVGLAPWKFERNGAQHTPNGSDVFPNGYTYAISTRQDESGPGKVADLRLFWIQVRKLEHPDTAIV